MSAESSLVFICLVRALCWLRVWTRCALETPLRFCLCRRLQTSQNIGTVHLMVLCNCNIYRISSALGAAIISTLLFLALSKNKPKKNPELFFYSFKFCTAQSCVETLLTTTVTASALSGWKLVDFIDLDFKQNLDYVRKATKKSIPVFLSQNNAATTLCRWTIWIFFFFKLENVRRKIVAKLWVQYILPVDLSPGLQPGSYFPPASRGTRDVRWGSQPVRRWYYRLMPCDWQPLLAQ